MRLPVELGAQPCETLAPVVSLSCLAMLQLVFIVRCGVLDCFVSVVLALGGFVSIGSLPCDPGLHGIWWCPGSTDC